MDILSYSILIFFMGIIIGLVTFLCIPDDRAFCCNSGTHWFVPGKPCPLCINGMVQEYKSAKGATVSPNIKDNTPGEPPSGLDGVSHVYYPRVIKNDDE